MNFSEFDIKVLVVSTIALLFISATAGATPIAGGFGDPPQYESDASISFDVPNQPGISVFSQGEIRWGAGIPTYKQNQKVVQSGGYEVSVSVINGSDETNEDVTIGLLVVNETGQTFVSEELDYQETKLMNTSDFGVKYTYIERTNSTATVKWELQYYPDLDNNYGALKEIASWFAYLGHLTRFVVSVLFGTIFFITEAIVGVVLYIFGIVAWITTGYGSIIGAAPSWAKIFVSIPAFLVGIELAKLLILAIQVIWIS